MSPQQANQTRKRNEKKFSETNFQFQFQQFVVVVFKILAQRQFFNDAGDFFASDSATHNSRHFLKKEKKILKPFAT